MARLTSTTSRPQEPQRDYGKNDYLRSKMADVVATDPAVRAYWQQRFEDEFAGKR